MRWLHNETSRWLSKWLKSAQANHQLRLALSNSTGATRLDQNTYQNNNVFTQAGVNSQGRKPTNGQVNGENGQTKSRASLLNSLTGNFSHWARPWHQKSYAINNNNSVDNNVIKRRNQATESLVSNTIGLQGAKVSLLSRKRKN